MLSSLLLLLLDMRRRNDFIQVNPLCSFRYYHVVLNSITLTSLRSTTVATTDGPVVPNIPTITRLTLLHWKTKFIRSRY